MKSKYNILYALNGHVAVQHHTVTQILMSIGSCYLFIKFKHAKRADSC